MQNLKSEAYNLVRSVDEQLERFEDSFDPMTKKDGKRCAKLRKVLPLAQKRYYRRNRTITSPVAIMTNYFQQAQAEEAKMIAEALFAEAAAALEAEAEAEASKSPVESTWQFV